MPLIDAARFYARHHGKGIKHTSVALAVDEMIGTAPAGGWVGFIACYLGPLSAQRWALSLAQWRTRCGPAPVSPVPPKSYFSNLTAEAELGTCFVVMPFSQDSTPSSILYKSQFNPISDSHALEPTNSSAVGTCIDGVAGLLSVFHVGTLSG